MSNADNQALVSELVGHIRRIGWFDIGHPGATDLTYPALGELLATTRLINIGDPWETGTVRHHTKVIEQQVVEIIGSLLGAPPQRWGYVTTGATEGTEYALCEALRSFPDVVAYYSTAAHYSVPKLVRKLGIRLVQIRATQTGHIDRNDLAGELRRRRHRAAIIIANAGTVWSEAVDDVAAISRTCQDLAISRLRIHVDAALAGIPLALLPQPQQPAYGFAAGATSMVISGHKFLSTLAPCGVLVFAEPPTGVARHRVPHTATVDTTIAGSRSGHMPVVLWHQLTRKDVGLDGHRERAARSRTLAAYLFDRLRQRGWDALYNPHAFTVVLRKPPPAVCERWLLAYQGQWAHIVCMPGILQDQIDHFLSDLDDAVIQPAEPPWPFPFSGPPLNARSARNG